MGSHIDTIRDQVKYLRLAGMEVDYQVLDNSTIRLSYGTITIYVNHMYALLVLSIAILSYQKGIKHA